MKLYMKVMSALMALLVIGGVVPAVSAATWEDTINETLVMVTSLLPRFGDLLTGVGDNLIWPVVYILIILGIAGIILSLFGMITGVVIAVVMAVRRFSSNLGGKQKY